MHLLEVETFQSTFGPKSTRKKPKMAGLDYDALVKAAEESSSSTSKSALHAFPGHYWCDLTLVLLSMYEAYSSDKDSNIKVEEDFKNEARLSMFDKGQSKRIWGELFKVCSVTSSQTALP
jgi:nuclear GTP-binding protein